METMQLNAWGNEYDLCIEVCQYEQNKNLALQLYFSDDGYWEPFATLTVNVGEKCNENCSYVDTNNCPWAPALIEKYRLGEYTGEVGFSGYCSYPGYKFNMSEIKKYEYREPEPQHKEHKSRDDGR